MPKRTDISSIMIIGAGPIIIGQAAEFDYSGSQAVKALTAEGYRVIVVNSNPATVMTDPELVSANGQAGATYIEPITPAIVAKIIEAERPDALLPTMGGQTALSTALALAQDGGVAPLGVDVAWARGAGARTGAGAGRGGPPRPSRMRGLSPGAGASWSGPMPRRSRRRRIGRSFATAWT